MTIHLKIPSALLRHIVADLARPHAFAAERVGFLGCKVAALPSDGLLMLARTFHSVADDDYLDDPTVGAMMGPSAIRKALQTAYAESAAMFHVHVHEHYGVPRLSRTDLKSAADFVPDFWHVQPILPHGALVLSLDSIAGLCWIPGRRKPTRISVFTIVGAPMRFTRAL